MHIINGKIFLNGTFQANKVIHVEGTDIQSVEDNKSNSYQANALDAEGAYIVPGFVDLQLNGGGGAYFTNDLTEEGVKTIFESHLKYGTTTFLPTLITTSRENIQKGIELTAKLMQHRQFGVLGMHLEGPFFHPAKRGAHPPEHIRQPSNEELDWLIEQGKETIKIITFAPEIFTDAQLAKLQATGWKLAAGHSMATYEQATSSFQKGVNLVTHLYNAMSQLESRAPGLVGAALDYEIWTSIILDGVHVDFAAARLAYRLCPNHLFFISDASFKDAPIKGEHLAGLSIEQHEDGQYYTKEGKLAGSCLSMYEAVVNAVQKVGIPLEAAIELATARPSAVIADDTIGVIKAGVKADLVLLNEDLTLKTVIKNGRIYR